MAYEMKIEYNGIVRQKQTYNTPAEVHKELKRKYIEQTIEKGSELIITIREV